MNWNKFTKKTMPDVEQQILIWIDYRNYGFAVVGQYDGEYITYASNWNGITELPKTEWGNCRWSNITPPEGAVL